MQLEGHLNPNHHPNGKMAGSHDLYDRFTRFWKENLPTLSGQIASVIEGLQN